MADYVFWGASGQSRVLAEILQSRGDRLVALFDNAPSAISPFTGVPLYIGSKGFSVWRSGANTSCLPKAVVAIGGSLGRDRCKIAKKMTAAGLILATLKHPQSIVSGQATLGGGCQILAGAIVGVGAVLRDNIIVNTGASVDHECELDDGVHVAPGARLCGCVCVGKHTLIGPGAIVLPRIKIGRDVVVGAGAVVTRDLPDNAVAWGAPARKKRANT